jgi:abortive infection bacteriophage resistance protein
MVFQILPFWDTTSIYQALNIPNKKLIANKYKLRFKQLESWLWCMYYLRNLCAHSDRVRNRRMTKKVNIKGGEDYFGTDIDFLFSYLVVICYLLRIISPECSRFSKIEKFIDTHTSVNRSKMWFPDNWKDIIKEKKLIVKDKLDTNI